MRSWHPHYLRHGQAALGLRAGRLLTTATQRRVRILAHEPIRATPFVITALARTGSTLLKGLLSGHPDVTAYGELFNRRIPLSRMLPGAWNVERLAPVRLLRRRVWHGRHEPGTPVGFKLLHSQGRQVTAPVRLYLRELPRLRVIHIVRRNELARYVSFEKAMRDRVWHLFGDGDPEQPRPPVTIDVEDLLNALRSYRSKQDEIRRSFQDHDFLELTYEELVADLSGHLRRVFTFLGVEPMDVEPSTRPTRTGPLAEDVANWDEVRQALRGTPWESMLHEPVTEGR